MDYEDDILPDQGDNIIRTKKEDIVINPKGIAYELFLALTKHKDKIGQIEANTGIEETFGMILQKAIRIACHLKKLGVTEDDIITPCTTNHLNTSPVFHAILFTGAKVAAMDPFAPDEDRIRQLELVQPKFIFAVPETVGALEKMINSLKIDTKIVVFGETKKHIPFEKFLVPLPEEENFSPFIVKDVRETALIVFSSGTTGSPKGICISNNALLIQIKTFVTPNEAEIYLSYASLVWASAILTTLATTILGGIKILASGFTPENAWSHLEKYKASFFYIAPQDLIALLKYGKPKDLRLPHLKVMFPIGGSLSVPTILKSVEMLPSTLVIPGYGQTELWSAALNPGFTRASQEILLTKPASCGRPLKRSTYKIVDPDTGKILGPYQPGELCIKSDTNMTGYYKADSSDRFDEDGFLKTGDIFYYDEDKWFFFVERNKEMLRYKMTAIAPSELENILIDHPSVKLAVVIGKPTDEGDLATAVIVKKDDNVTAKELEDLVAGQVDDRKKLRGGVYFVDESEIPFTPSRKIKRRALKQYILKKIDMK